MRNVYHLTFMMTAIVLLITIIQSYMSKKEIVKTLRRLLVAAEVATLANTIVVTSESETACMIAYSLFFVGIDWLLYFLMQFIMKYTGSRNLLRWGPSFFGVIMIVDSISMLGNCFFQYAFRAKRVITADGEVFFRLNYYLPYQIHLVISYLLIAFAVTSLIVKLIKTPQVYHFKYLSVLLVLAAVVAGDAVYVFLGGVIDVSIIGFAIGGVMIYYMAVIYVPNGVVDRLLSMVVHDIVDGVLLFDKDGNCIHINNSAMLFLEPEKRSNPIEFCENWYQEELKRNQSEDGRDDIICVEGKKLYLHIYLKKLLDDRGEEIGAFINMKNRTKEVHDLAAERYKATHDSLTGIYNMDYFSERARQTLEENPQEEYILVCSDINNFKLINDVFGTQNGDKLLKRISKILHRLAQPGQVYGRIGTDRFAILMKKSDYDENLFEAVARKYVYMEHSVEYAVHIYFGVYGVTEREIPVSVMCDRAKMAIETIKGNYQQHLAYYDEQLRANFLKEQEIMGELDEAIETGQLCFYLQPQVGSDGMVNGAEALVRWRHPVKGVLPPSQFVDLFEKNGAIVRVDQYIWELACRKLQEWKKQGNDNMYLSVNISPKDFFFIDVYETITGLVKKYEIDPKNLHLEITETTVMTDIEQKIALIERFQAFGLLVEMDDFGSGYSSLNMLKDIHVDVLKIDMEFLRQTTETQRGEKILRTIISLAGELGMEAIVEGVETSEQLAFLKSINCDLFQGYYFARPMETSQFEEIYMKK